MSNSNEFVRYSAKVVATLLVSGIAYPIASVGPDRLSFRKGQTIEAGTTGQLNVQVDNELYQWDVEITDGAVPFDGSVKYVQVKRQKSLFS